MVNLRPGHRVAFGPPERPLEGEVLSVEDGTVTVVVDDFMGRRVPFTVTDPETIRRVPVRRMG